MHLIIDIDFLLFFSASFTHLLIFYETPSFYLVGFCFITNSTLRLKTTFCIFLIRTVRFYASLLRYLSHLHTHTHTCFLLGRSEAIDLARDAEQHGFER